MSLAQSLPGQQRSTAQMAALVEELFTTTVISPNAIDPYYWFGKLDNIGAPALCEMIARGALRADIALSLEVPLTLLAEWCENNISSADMNRALRMHAEVCVMKGRILLATVNLSPADSAQARVLADRLFLHAERIDRLGWSPSAKETSTPPPVLVQVNLPGYGVPPPAPLASSFVVEHDTRTYAAPLVTALPTQPVLLPLLPTQGRRANTPPIRVP